MENIFIEKFGNISDDAIFGIEDMIATVGSGEQKYEQCLLDGKLFYVTLNEEETHLIVGVSEKKEFQMELEIEREEDNAKDTQPELEI